MIESAVEEAAKAIVGPDEAPANARLQAGAALSAALDHLASTDEGRAYLKALLKEHDG